MVEPFCVEHSVRQHVEDQPWIIRMVATGDIELQLIDGAKLPDAHLAHCSAGYEVSEPAHLECPMCHAPEMRIRRAYIHTLDRAAAEQVFDAVLSAEQWRVKGGS